MGAILFSPYVVFAQVPFQFLQWNNRVLVLNAPEDAPSMDEQIALLGQSLAEIEERELIVLRLRTQVLEPVSYLSPFPFEAKILDDREERRYLQSLFVGGEDIRLTLIGLDGEIKGRWDGVTDPFLVFDAIDSMPMRQRALEEQEKR